MRAGGSEFSRRTGAELLANAGVITRAPLAEGMPIGQAAQIANDGGPRPGPQLPLELVRRFFSTPTIGEDIRAKLTVVDGGRGAPPEVA